jgi:hypothetical protein
MRTSTLVWRILLSVVTIVAMSAAASAQAPAPATQEPAASAPKPPPANKYVIRGCLTGSTLKEIEPTAPPLKLPEKLRVTSLRGAIRDQVKALSGHQVELTGALFGVPGVEEGILVSDSDDVRILIGGADPNSGEAPLVNYNNPPTIRATTIKDVAPACSHR